MRPHTLEILKKIHDGTLDVSRQRDIDAAAPLIFDYVRHEDINALEALFQARLNQARASGIPDQERAVYWETIARINSARDRDTSPAITDWLLSKYENMSFSLFSEEEVNQNQERHRAHQENPNNPAPKAITDQFSLYLDVYWILKTALHQLDRATMLRAADIVKNHFMDQIHKGSHRGDGFLDYRVDMPPIRKATPTETVAHTTALLGLADELDHTLGFTDCRLEIIGSCFIASLRSDTPKEVQSFFIEQAGNLNVDQKESLFKKYAYDQSEGTRKEFPCHTTHQGYFGVPLFMSDPGPLAHLERLANAWKMRKAFGHVLVAALRGHYFDPANPYGYSFISDVENKFDPSLTWNEIVRRLMKARKFMKDMPDPRDWGNKHYFEIAMKRAVQFGHAQDLRAVFDHFKSLPQEAQVELNSWHAFPFHEDRVSRDPETLQVLADNLPLSTWVSGRHKSDNSGPIISSLMLLIPDGSDHWNFDHALCSYIGKGQVIPDHDRVESMRVLIPLLDRVLDQLPDENKEELIDTVFPEREHYREFSKSTFAAIVYSGKMDLVQMYLGVMQRHMTPALLQKRVLGYVDYTMDRWYHALRLEPMVQLFSTLQKDENLGPAFVVKALAECDGMNAIKAFLVRHFLGLEQPSPDVGGYSIWKLDPRIHDVYLAQVKTFKGTLDSLEDKCLREGGYRNNGMARKNFDLALYNELYPLLRLTQREEGQESGSHDADNHAKKLATLFPTLRRADTFIRHHAMPGRQPVHDLCLFVLPDPNQSWDKEAWGNLAIRYGWAVLRYLGHAPAVEKYINGFNGRRRIVNLKHEKTGKNVNARTIDLHTLKPSMIRAIVNRVGYSQANENRAAADFCLKLGVTERAFNKAVELLTAFKAAAKKPDRTPDIHINGADIGLDGYVMRKVPKGDIICLFVGKMVNCCNHIDDNGHASGMAIAQFNGTKNALYIIQDKKGRPVAKLSGWMTDKGNLTFNAWERLSDEEDFLMSRFVLAAGIQALTQKPKIKRVLLGAGPIKDGTVPFERASDPENPAKGAETTADSKEQFVVVAKDFVSTARGQLQKEIERAASRGDVRVKATYEERREQQDRHRRNAGQQLAA